MGLPTIVGGTTITASWGNLVRDAAVNVFASAAARASAVAAPTEGMVSVLADVNRLEAHDGAAYQRLVHYAAAGRTGGMWRRAANQSINDVAVTDISWDAEDFDSDGYLTPTSATFTIPSGFGGLYNIAVAMVPQFSASVSAANFYLNVNGTVVWMLPLGGDSTTSGSVSHSFSLTDWPLTAGDACKIQFIHNSGSARNYRSSLKVFRNAI